jgi:osmotically-inducible protein OsmY
MQNKKQSSYEPKQNQSRQSSPMGWDKSGRDYHSSNYGQDIGPGSNYGQDTNLNRGQNYSRNDQYLGDMHAAPPQNLGRARDDAEYAFSRSRGQISASDRDETYGRNDTYDNDQYGTDSEKSYYANNTGSGSIGRSAWRNRQDILRTRGDNDAYSTHTNSGYGRDNYDSTRYGESDVNYGRNEANRSLSGYGQNYSQDRLRKDGNEESHFGKGPKGYKRSDTRIQEDVHEALTRDHDIDASEIEVSVKDGIVTLSGSVTERKMKRLAEDCVENISGVVDVRNEISSQQSAISSFFSGSGTKTEAKNAKTKNTSSNTDMM